MTSDQTAPKSQILTEGRSGTVTPIRHGLSNHGTRITWQVNDGTYIVTSSAHHYLAPSTANNPDDDMAWIGRTLTGQNVHDDPSLVSETVVFDADETGRILDMTGVAKLFVSEAHEEALTLAGYTIKENQQ